MTASEFEKILSGELIPTFTPVDYTTEEAQASLQKVLEEQRKCIERKTLHGNSDRRAHDFSK